MARNLAGGSNYWQVNTVIASPPFTFACWFRPTDNTSDGGLMNIIQEGSPDNLHMLAYRGNTDDNLIVHTRNGGGGSGSALSTTTVTDQTWHHAAGVWASASDRTVFLDGGNSANNTTNVSPTAPSHTSIGRGGTGYNQFIGDMAEAAMWDVALSAGEVLALAKGWNPQEIRYANLIGYWPLRGIVSPETDYTPFATKHNMSLTGSSSAASHPPMARFMRERQRIG